MRKLFVATFGRYGKKKAITDDYARTLAVANDEDELVQAAYDIGYQDAKNEPRWQGHNYMIGEEKVGLVWEDFKSSAVRRFRGVLFFSLYGCTIFAAFKTHNEAAKFVEKFAMKKEDQPNV